MSGWSAGLLLSSCQHRLARHSEGLSVLSGCGSCWLGPVRFRFAPLVIWPVLQQPSFLRSIDQRWQSVVLSRPILPAPWSALVRLLPVQLLQPILQPLAFEVARAFRWLS